MPPPEPSIRRRAPWRRLAVGLALLLALPAAAATPRPPAEKRLVLLVTSGLSGSLVQGGGEQTVAALAATVRRLAEQARARGEAVAVFDAGRTLLPYAESRYDGGETMARVLVAAGCEAFAPEAMDFTLGLSRLRELAADEVPFPVLRPFSGPDPRLEAFEPYAVLDPEGGPRLVLVSLFDRFYAGNLAKSGIAAEIHRPGEALAKAPEAVGAIRVAVVHSAGRSSSMLDRRLTWELVEEPRGFDLLIDPDFGHDLVLNRQGDEGHVLLVGRERSREAPWTVAEIVLDLERHEDRWRPAAAALTVHGADPALSPDRELEARIHGLVAEFRRAGERRFPAEAPTTREDLETFILQTIREAADAEVAIVNRGALHAFDPALLGEGPLRLEVVHRLLALDQHLVVGKLTGGQLRGLASASARRRDAEGRPRKSSLVFFGLGRSAAGGLEVNGRPLYPEDDYRVVTNSFLASGGDDYPDLTRLEGAEPLHLPSGRLGEVRDDYVVPRLDRSGEAFVDLERRGLWRYGVDRVGLEVEGTQTTADPAYQGVPDSRARAGDSASVLARLRLRADQEWRGFRWENRLRGRFGLVDASGEERSELEDDLRFEISGLFTDKTLLGGKMYASWIFDTEFRRNETRSGARLPRQQEQSLAAGLRWATGRWPLVRVGLLARHQSDFEDADRLGLFAEAELSIAGRRRRPGLEGRLFAENLENSDATIQRFDAEIALLFPLGDSLSFTPAFNFYLYDDSRLAGAARYQRLSLGLTYSWHGKHQRR